MPDPVIVRIMREYRAELLRRDRDQMVSMVNRWSGIDRALQDRLELLAMRVAELRAAGKVITPGLLAREDRYRALLGQTRQEITRYTRWLDGQISDTQAAYGKLGAESAQAAIRSASVDLSFNTLPVSVIENMVGLAGDGSPLLSLLREAWPTAADGMLEELINATALGLNPRATARRMARGMSRGLDRCMTIARTEQLRVFREANRQQMVESGVVEGYRRVSAKDMRVCPSCLFSDGREFPLSVPFAEHPNGRCVAVPVVTGEKPIDWEYGAEWFGKQDQTTQLAILGAGRHALWKDGTPLENMVEVRANKTWGPSIGLVPVNRLGG